MNSVFAMIKPIRLAILASFVCFLSPSCKQKDTTHVQQTTNPTNNAGLGPNTPVKGYNLLSKINGIWDGPVTSTTSLGSYPEWIVDFRAISPSQISAKNELDTLNNIFMSFFVVYHNSEYKLAFRNGGAFGGMQRVAYMVADSVFESPTRSYYRFVDFVKGKSKTITEVIFGSDSVTLQSFTNKYNTLTTPTLHMQWKAARQDTGSASGAKAHFGYPQKTLVKDFSTTFAGVTESVYYQLNGDPYPESAQPYLGKSQLSYTVSPTLTLSTSNKITLLVTTRPLIAGGTLNAPGMKTRTRYVILPGKATNTFLFNYMHPGNYYLYAFYDKDGNGQINSGDYMSSANTTFSLSPLGNSSATTQIDFVIP
jgi:hypothetical protein